MSAQLIRSTIYLPSNDEFTALATQTTPRAPALPAPRTPSTSELFRQGVLGLASHTVPHLRRFFTDPPRVVSATVLRPWGYHAVFTANGRTGVLLGLLPGEWAPQWRFEVFGPSSTLEVVYPPSYVMAGSASATLTSDGGSRTVWRSQANGYRTEWVQLADAVDGRRPLAVSVEDLAADLTFALALADGADSLLTEDT